MKHRLLLCLALGAALPLGAQAARFTTIVPGESAITFHYTQMGVGLEGSFGTLGGTLDFDTAAPTQGKAVLEVTLGSVDAGADEANDELRKPEWLNIPTFPVARFESQRIVAKGDGYEVAGSLSIKGRSVDVVAPATFTQNGNTGVFSGKFTIRRSDFGIGEGAWAKPDIVADEIDVVFRLSATE